MPVGRGPRRILSFHEEDLFQYASYIATYVCECSMEWWWVRIYLIRNVCSRQVMQKKIEGKEEVEKMYRKEAAQETENRIR